MASFIFCCPFGPPVSAPRKRRTPASKSAFCTLAPGRFSSASISEFTTSPRSTPPSDLRRSRGSFLFFGFLASLASLGQEGTEGIAIGIGGGGGTTMPCSPRTGIIRGSPSPM
eukprot:CAMPEP_0181487460 /NCGR_PEP_ID=MMETSP1110-20121109/47825_1 /TAXON_ID=174948 /ORGANISM="Symbiodinium sp., Strain CCMP421" /LENGTH=112 /DNA_ID=CAMNT_0023613957 /DNA_START=274 /DNA_END=612 /DNA_ORIENTATION=+